MNYTVTFKVTYKNDAYFIHTESFQTKGKNRKVLKASIRKIINNLFSDSFGFKIEDFDNIEVLKIIRTDEVNFNNVWNKIEYKKFLDKKFKRT